MTSVETYVSCAQCDAGILPEDSTYDDHTSQCFCDMTCFRDWTDGNNDVVTDFYAKLNITE